MSSLSYVKLINLFWMKDAEHSYSGSETRLYFYLLKKANSHHWQVNPLSFSDFYLLRAVGISANTLKQARIRLEQTGLIALEVKRSNQRGRKSKDEKCRYTIYGVELSKIHNSTDNFSDNSTDNFSHNTSDNFDASTPYSSKEDKILKDKIDKEGESPPVEKPVMRVVTEEENPSPPVAPAPSSRQEGWPRSFTAAELRVMIEAFSQEWWIATRKNYEGQGVNCEQALIDWCTANDGRDFNERTHLRNSLTTYLTNRRERVEQRGSARPANSTVQDRLQTMQEVKKMDEQAPPVFDRPRRAAGQ
jgi:hypothetical protein